ncbi:hypothetical protein B9Z55_004449 [Caenorhabditis nigoni]|uniref:Uncharacterized protein n=1 Tax=Caenorhabditis nigoni TaxID=1611254 RepID=A0A2G5UWI4_9PELO|nr:hypothetical protein B9Z55_004449 [Caenorhabditis nigoni]
MSYTCYRRIRLLETIARRWEIIDPIDPTFGADKQVTVALEPLAEHIRRQVAYEFDLSTKLQKLEKGPHLEGK